MDTIKDLYDLRDELRNVGYCNLTTDLINAKLNNNSTTELYLIEAYEDTEQTMDYLSFVILKINDELTKRGYVTISIRNSSGNDATLAHHFGLFLIDEDYYRMESYEKTAFVKSRKTIKEVCSSLYSTRIVEWGTCYVDIIKLLKMPSGIERLSYWNGLFSSDEQYDIEGDLDISLSVID